MVGQRTERKLVPYSVRRLWALRWLAKQEASEAREKCRRVQISTEEFSWGQNYGSADDDDDEKVVVMIISRRMMMINILEGDDHL